MLPHRLLGPFPLGDINEGCDGVRSAAKLDERRAQKDLADFAAAGPDRRLRIVQRADGFEARPKLRCRFCFHDVQFRGSVTDNVFARPADHA